MFFEDIIDCWKCIVYSGWDSVKGGWVFICSWNYLFSS